jgi:hypothetical protein
MQLMMKTIFSILILFCSVNFFAQASISSTMTAPFNNGRTFVDYNLPNEDKQPGTPDSIPARSQGWLSIHLASASWAEIQAVILEVGPELNNSTYLSETITSPFATVNNLLPLRETFKFYRPIGTVWLSVTAKYADNTLSNKSYIQIQ